jgi:phage/plasmid-like protein (TIGR03299 family)
MSHLIDMSNSRANIAFVGETPWHGLGTTPKDPKDLDQWIQDAGLGFNVLKAPAYAHLTNAEGVETGDVVKLRNLVGLYRDDTKQPLGHVSDSHYKIVQPRQVIEFFRDLIKDDGFTLDVAGSLKGGKRVWALAQCNKEIRLPNGRGQPDTLRPYLLFNTTYDNQRATQAQFTMIRVVCNNTISMAHQEFDAAIVDQQQEDARNKYELRDACKAAGITGYSKMTVDKMRELLAAATNPDNEKVTKLLERTSKKPKYYVQIPHSRELIIPEVHAELGLVLKAAEQFGDVAQELAKRRVNTEEATKFVAALFGKYEKKGGELTAQSQKVMTQVVEAIERSPGADFVTAKGTAWGLLNGVTHFLDFQARARSTDNRLNSAWFGDSAHLKIKAMEAAKQLVAA